MQASTLKVRPIKSRLNEREDYDKLRAEVTGKGEMASNDGGKKLKRQCSL